MVRFFSVAAACRCLEFGELADLHLFGVFAGCLELKVQLSAVLLQIPVFWNSREVQNMKRVTDYVVYREDELGEESALREFRGTSKDFQTPVRTSLLQ
jgi:hypothetical protein